VSAEPVTLVLDASVGVKWFKPEPGSEAALDLARSALSGDARLVAPIHFAHEVLSVVGRFYQPRDIPAAWERLTQLDLALVPLADEVVAEASRQCDALGCSFYDALAPACAVLLGATLASADRRAHGGFPGVVIVE